MVDSKVMCQVVAETALGAWAEARAGNLELEGTQSGASGLVFKFLGAIDVRKSQPFGKSIVTYERLWFNSQRLAVLSALPWPLAPNFSLNLRRRARLRLGDGGCGRRKTVRRRQEGTPVPRAPSDIPVR